MKKYILTISLLALTILGCNDEAKKTSNVSESSMTSESIDAYPILTFEETEHDFGTMIQGEEKGTKFKFTNTGDAVLQIESITAKCGCTVPNDWPKQPIKPGEGGEFTVNFNSRSKNGRIKQPITITSNTKSKTDVVTITATVVTE